MLLVNMIRQLTKVNQKKPVRRPPLKLNSMDTYDSVLGESKIHGGALNYREFVVYDRYQVYPEYVISFDRIGPASEISNITNCNISNSL